MSNSLQSLLNKDIKVSTWLLLAKDHFNKSHIVPCDIYVSITYKFQISTFHVTVSRYRFNRSTWTLGVEHTKRKTKRWGIWISNF